ncbi:hypothetical protein [Rhizobium sp. AC27/96]|uniref:hypothetical protein n=1 Tax=Rhizobium sp. AC27/96 TaxID=1841653 RepID=UPI001146124A|nr:hypothetical protein [Rhizobium sp. AC27/96]
MPDWPDQLPPAPKGGNAARTTREIHDKRRNADPPDPNGFGQRRGARLFYHLPAVVVLPVLPMSVRIVPLKRIKSKKIPIVQPILTFNHKKNWRKIFIHKFQSDISTQNWAHCLLVNGIFLVLYKKAGNGRHPEA